MDIRIKYQGIEASPWMIEYMKRQTERLERFLSSSAIIFIEFTSGPVTSNSHLLIQSRKKSFSFESSGEDIFEAFSKTLDEACRFMKLEHHRVISRVHQQLFFAKAIDE